MIEPLTAPAPKRLHLGCGAKYIPGLYHIDALDYPHVDRIGRVDDLGFLADESVEFIYACHVLEHFGRHVYRAALAEWRRVLMPGGVLRLAVPDFGACARLYCEGRLASLNDVTGLLVGGQRDEYDYHKMIFDESSLTEALKAVGFSEVRRWDWRETEHAGIDDYSQAYLPHMEKETGTLASLNLEGVS